MAQKQLFRARISATISGVRIGMAFKIAKTVPMIPTILSILSILFILSKTTLPTLRSFGFPQP
jgi:hypothetical protein